MKRYSLTQLAQAYLILCEGASSAHALRVVAAALILQHRTHQADLVVREIQRQQLLRHGQANVTITTAHQLPSKLRHTLEKIIAKLINAKTIAAQYTLQPDIIGGFRAETPAHEIDASIAHMLARL